MLIVLIVVVKINMTKFYYNRQRQKLIAATLFNKALRDKWERMEKKRNRLLTLDELTDYIGYVNTLGRYVGPQRNMPE